MQTCKLNTQKQGRDDGFWKAIDDRGGIGSDGFSPLQHLVLGQF